MAKTIDDTVAPMIAITTPAKKKRTRAARGTGAPTSRKRKRKSIAMGTPFEALPVVEASSEPASTPSANDLPIQTAAAEAVATGEPVEAAIASEPAVPQPEPEPIDEAIAFHMLTAVDHTVPSEPPVEESGTWQPRMPAPGTTTTSTPWRTFLPPRPSVTTTPSLVAVIDDADPEGAEHAFEARRRSAKERGLSAFLPPILLDREDRSARQGGLTLAVIILLIAATLTLSYLMRRPSASGDGVTQTATEQLEILA